MDKRTGVKPKKPVQPQPEKGRFALGSVSAPVHDYPLFCLRHLASGYTLDECNKVLKGLFASKLYYMSQKSWIDLENDDHWSGSGFERIPKEQFKAKLPAIVTEDVAKMHVIRFNGKTGRIVGLRSTDTFHITHIEIDKTAYDHGS